MFRALKPSLTSPRIPALELIKRTAKEVLDDDCMGIAAQLAYYFALALFPALLFIVALASYLPYNVIHDVVAALAPIAPPEVLTIIRKQLESIVAGEQTSLLTIGVLGALWSSSGAMTSIVSALNRAYDIPETRPWWKVRLVAVGLTIALVMFVLLSFTLIVAGPNAGRYLTEWLGLPNLFDTIWRAVRWPLVFALATTGIAIVFYHAPNADQDWIWITPGSILATVLWIVFSMGFRLYATRVGDFAATYGALAGAAILLLWLYCSALALLIGGELNSEIEHAANPELKNQKTGPWRFKAFAKVPAMHPLHSAHSAHPAHP
ncbi:MAG TPA: YihY/virulence factor BrkB family protein [Steroidobacteraceae bacterium]|nr:YihY/virulence factor BrkB family protein [Steroidobacteraceae bacterium]